MSYYYYGEFYLNAHTGFKTMKKVSFFIGWPSYVQELILYKFAIRGCVASEI